MLTRPGETFERDRSQIAPLKHENIDVRMESRGKEEVREGTDEWVQVAPTWGDGS